MKDFCSLSDEDWRILVDEFDVNEPTICYPDPDRRGAYVGPLAKIPVGCTVENDDGDEVLDLEGADGRNLFAVACLPQFAELVRWIRAERAKIDQPSPLPIEALMRFLRQLLERIDWIEQCINDRDMEIGAGSGPIGFVRFGEHRQPAK